jgi:creatinine amidohydrolase
MQEKKEETMSRQVIEEMSWTEFDELRMDVDTVLFPMGSVEVEGPHLPLGVDSIVALEVAKKVAAGKKYLVAPLINVTYSEWHMGFPGTLSIRLSTLTQMLREICEDLVEHGLRKIMFINSHVGNDPAIMEVAHELLRRSEARVGMVNLWAVANQMGKDIPELKEKTFLHAGEIMTSVMLALRPELVDMSKAKKEYLQARVDGFVQKGSPQVTFKGISAYAYHLSDEVTKSGVMGDPLAASKEKGDKIIGLWVEFIRGYIEEFRKLPLQARP